MGYIITENNGKFDLTESGYKRLKLGVYATRKEAEVSLKKWEARDDLGDQISDFFHNVIDNFGTILTEKEIIEMIKEYN